MLSSPLSSIGRITPSYQKRLKKLGLETVRDLIYYFPFRYDDFSKIIPVSQLKIGQTQAIQGKILEIKNTRTWRKKMALTEAVLEDNTGAIKIVWFNQPFLIRNLKKGDLVNLAGKVQFDGSGLYLSSPIYEKIHISDKIKLTHTGRLVPVYPETKGLSSRWLRYILRILLPQAIRKIPEFLPPQIIKKQGLLGLKEALRHIHFPDNQEMAQRAKKRLGFNEIFLIQLFLLQQRQNWQKNQAVRIKFDQPLIKNFVAGLPFKLTDAQRKAAWEILKDLEKPKPMNRLLEGDVGSGKTVVAAIAALQVIKSKSSLPGKNQVALMAPTEILAQQHWQTINKLFESLSIKMALLTSGQTKIYPESRACSEKPKQVEESNILLRAKKTSRQEIIQKIAQGQIQLIIGTHALIQKKVKFKNLVLAIVDEQHRFGVQQRAALQKNLKKIPDQSPEIIPHLLSMTATPIPRSLALTVYGDLDLSLLDQMPKGRKKIITRVVAPAERQKAYNFIKQQVKKGRQVFVICPRIESQGSPDNSKNLSPSSPPAISPPSKRGENQRGVWADVKTVKEEYEKLSKKIFPDLKIAMLHGRLKSKEKNQIMEDFKNKKVEILVSTSVVEVGVDIPNTTVMMIEGADRFGLAQLHQFRGRVGRSEHQSYCLLFTNSTVKSTQQRLRALVSSENGFALAEKDLQIRGPGEFIGSRQWGIPDLSMASLSDVNLIKASRSEAQNLLIESPELKKYPLLADKIKGFGEKIHLE